MQSPLPPKIRNFLWLLVALLATGCSTTKFLKDDQEFLVKNRIEIVSPVKIKKKRNLQNELATLYKQKPNENFFFFIPKEWFYYRLQDTVGKSRFSRGWKRWQMRQFGEEPSIFDPERAEGTERAMQFYLQNKGYFKAKVESFTEYQDRRKNQKVVVTYRVEPRQRYLISDVSFSSSDTTIDRLLQEIKPNTVLEPGSPVDVSLYDQEVKRVTDYLRNQGYAYFIRNFVSGLEGDSSNNQVDLSLEVLPPPNDSVHRVYRIGNVYIYPQYNPSEPTENRIDSIGPGIYFISTDGEYGVKPKTLINALYFKKGDLYRQIDFDRTNRALGNLGIFRFVTIKDERDPNNQELLNYRIFLTPNKRFEIGTDIEVNTSNSPFVGRRLLGVAGNLSFRHRNLFKGAELFVGNAETGLDLNLSNLRNLSQLVTTLDIRLQTNLYYPKFVDYIHLWRGLSRIGFLRDGFYEEVKEKASTRIGLSYNYIEQFDFTKNQEGRDTTLQLYVINSFNASFGYDFRLSNRNRFLINHVGIDYLSPNTTTHFDTLILNKNEFLRRSFDKQLFTSLLFRDFNFSYNSLPNRFGESFSLITRMELSGLEVFAANKLYDSFKKNGDSEVFALRFPNDTISFSQFFRIDVDLRHYRQFNPRQSMAMRLYSGIATPFGYSGSVPYVKQFFVGGPQSIRAWAAREIGPGGNAPESSSENTTLFYQTGDFKLEFNAEYRFFLLSFLGVRFEGALFLDAGNVWSLRDDPDRELEQLLWNARYDENNEKTGDNFLKYLAIGTGAGLRVDFSYFIFRLDVGVKVRNPYPTLVEDGNGSSREVHWRWQIPGAKPFQNLNYNIGLGYPF